MRGFAVMVGLLTSIGCDRVFQIVSVEDEARVDASADAAVDAPPNAVTVTFGETGDATYSSVTFDTYLTAASPASNFGADGRLYFDNGSSPKVALIRFDVSQLPALAQIVSASLRLTTDTDKSPDPTVAVRMLEQWDEGSVDGTAGEASWTYARNGVLWSGPGAAPPSRGTANLGSFIPDTYDTSYELVLEPAVVAAWVADPDFNFGLALVSQSGDGATVRSSDSSTISKRPLLTVVFVPP